MPRRPESSPASAMLQPLALGAEPAGGVDADVVEAHRRGGRAGEAHLALRRVGAEALGGGRHQEARDPVAVVGRAGHDLVEVGVAAVRRPGLGAVEDVGVAVAAGRRTHRRGVGAGVRLGEAVGAEQVTAQHVGQPLGALLVGAEVGQAEAGERVHRHPDADRGPHGADLLEDLEVDLVGLVAAAVLLGVGQRQQAGLAEHPEDLAREGLGGLRLGRPRRELLGRDLAGEGEQVAGLVGGQLAASGQGQALCGGARAVWDLRARGGDRPIGQVRGWAQR